MELAFDGNPDLAARHGPSYPDINLPGNTAFAHDFMVTDDLAVRIFLVGVRDDFLVDAP
jgi:hypothetical protein